MNEATARSQNRMNRVNQYTPYGNLQYSEAGGDRWNAVQTLDPSQQRQLDLSNQASETYGRAAATQLGQVEGQMSRPFDPNLPAMRMDVHDRVDGIRTSLGDYSGGMTGRPDFTGIGDPNQSRDRVEASLNERQAPLQERDRAQLDSRLLNQGLQPGTAAYTAAMGDHYRGVNDARLATIGAAGQEQSRMYGLGFEQAGLRNETAGQLASMDANRGAFQNQALSQQTNMDLTRAGFYNQARGQSLAEQLQMRNQPINEASALLTGNMIQNPNYVNVPGANVAPTDYAGIVANSANMRQRQYEQKVSQRNAATGAIAGLVGTGVGAAFGSPWLGGMIGGGAGKMMG